VRACVGEAASCDVPLEMLQSLVDKKDARHLGKKLQERITVLQSIR